MKPGSGVSTNPNATLPPGATVGTVGWPGGGGARVSVKGTAFTVSRVLPLMFTSVADIVDWPFATSVAKPVAAIVAASVFDDAHVTDVVKSFVLESAKVPVAWNCSVVPA